MTWLCFSRSETIAVKRRWWKDLYKTWAPGPWTTPLDQVHGPLCGPGPWTTPLDHPWFLKMNFYQRPNKRILGTLNGQNFAIYIIGIKGSAVWHMLSFFFLFLVRFSLELRRNYLKGTWGEEGGTSIHFRSFLILFVSSRYVKIDTKTAA